MADPGTDQHLSRLSTHWQNVHQAHADSPSLAHSAQKVLLKRYEKPIQRYLLGALRDREAAEELFQEFSLRFLRGDFKRACPERGRFRDYVKTVLCHLVIDYQRRQRRQPQPLVTEFQVQAAAASPTLEADQEFQQSCRDELLGRTWQALEEVEHNTGQPCHTILRFRTDNPLLSSADLAEQLGPRLGRVYTVDALRHALQRAREKFTDLLLTEVIESLGNPSLRDLQDELLDLGLSTYCQAALKRRGLA